MNNYKIYGIDFDGTLCENQWPEIGEPKQKIIDFCIRKREQGHKLILWTCRSGQNLANALKWCNDRGLFFHAVNSNLPEQIILYDTDPRKIGADYYIDDKNITIGEIEKQEREEERLSIFANLGSAPIGEGYYPIDMRAMDK